MTTTDYGLRSRANTIIRISRDTIDLISTTFKKKFTTQEYMVD